MQCQCTFTISAHVLLQGMDWRVAGEELWEAIASHLDDVTDHFRLAAVSRPTNAAVYKAKPAELTVVVDQPGQLQYLQWLIVEKRDSQLTHVSASLDRSYDACTEVAFGVAAAAVIGCIQSLQHLMFEDFPTGCEQAFALLAPKCSFLTCM